VYVACGVIKGETLLKDPRPPLKSLATTGAAR